MARLPLSSHDRLYRLEKEVERLKRRHALGWPWYSLESYLCGGWIDPYADNRPFWSDDFDPDDSGTNNTAAGFFDTGQALIFTGTVFWDPEGWWITPPYASPLFDDASDPDFKRSHGALEFVIGNRDGLGNVISPTSVDSGQYMDYRIAGSEQLMQCPAYASSAQWDNGFWTGASMMLVAINDINGLKILIDDPIRVGGGQIVDPDGNTHYLPPVNSWWNLAGNTLMLEQAAEDPEP